MSTSTRRFACPPAAVFSAIADPWLTPAWAAGASRLRAADPRFPAPGSRLRHSFGVWPFVLPAETRVEEWDPPRRAVLSVRVRPFGRQRVVIEAVPRGPGCVVLLEEHPVAGPVTLVPDVLVDAVLGVRNAETLRRLEWVARGRA